MSKNPFDGDLSPEIHRQIQGNDFEQAQAELVELMQHWDQDHTPHEDAWGIQMRNQHTERLALAIKLEEQEDRFIPRLAQEKLDRDDDVRFARLKRFDSLLELRSPQEYLRARRAWERRHGVVDLELNVTIKPIDLGPTEEKSWKATGTGIVSVIAALVIAFMVIAAAAENWLLAIPMVVIGVLVWAFVVRMSVAYTNVFSSGSGRGATGGAV